MRIGELAKRTGASVRSLRYYEEQRLLRSDRSPSGQRLYAESDVDRILLVRRLFAAGLSSRIIAELLPCVDRPSWETAHEAWRRLVEERERLDAHIAELVRTRDSLDEVIAENREHVAAFASAASRG
ncbi:MerR family transcriptional regulator [Streptomonospora wellingtoniae]|uniref:MerR family transcriptional regulator n=1 Tax=Streptomonospora wellingtoniae TaxID=3075544 RepID=A0ABU2KRH7_9ACTN|nr:MerR family transcriptional regulator [Streptomonospora sp. DSM 45055]MDT0301777.1 MerR family transcriptional regulator [Streptomonospora sp. DSM 45055]